MQNKHENNQDNNDTMKVRTDETKALMEKRKSAAEKLINIPGHPLNTFELENRALTHIVEECRREALAGHVSHGLLEQLRQVAVHYAKKGDLLYPHLEVKYGISGPSKVLWTQDDEIRDELRALFKKENEQDEEWMERFLKVLTRIEEMIYKETNILFANCAINFTNEEWIGIYRDSKDYAVCFGVDNTLWDEAESAKSAESGSGSYINTDNNENAQIVMPGGHMNVEQLTAMLNTIPLEITFVDENDINRFFNEGSKVFKRPGMAIDREVFSCHPPKIEQQVRRIISEFKAGTLDKVPIWMDKNGKTMLVTYMAVRDKSGKYLGTMEIVQDMEFAKEHFMPCPLT